MLKWLKQKPLDVHGHGQDSLEVIENITDDPLATIQVQSKKNNSNNVNHKKSTKINSNNEIYAVSRVNPLFEEEDNNGGGGGNGGVNKGGGISPGNHSGSSGYDSGPSDDDSLNKKTTQYDYVNSTETNNHLFSGQEDIIIHHEAGIIVGENYLTSNGRPILQILEQNPHYVKNISVAINRPLTPIEESIIDGGNKKLLVNSISIPTRNIITTKPGDSLGVAKVLQRNKNYVQSIRIGPGPIPTDGQFQQQRRQNYIESSNSNSNNNVVTGRKPSVTFSEKVDFVGGRVGNNNSRRTSSEQDSIVTESLLMMTSNHNHYHQQVVHPNNDLLLQEVRARRNHMMMMKSETDVIQTQSRPDLTDFSNSLSKNRIVRQIVSNGGLHPPPPAEDDSGGSGDGAVDKKNNGSDDDDEDENVNEEDHYSGERSDSSSSAASTSAKSQTTSSSSRKGRSISSNTSSHKSPFGGIADHYAAAKEIAKEIESYSTTASGKSMGISLVRDLLLSNRGRNHSSSTSSSSFSFKQNKTEQREEGYGFGSGPGNRFGGTLVSTVVQVQPQPGDEISYHNKHSHSNNLPDKPWLHPQVYVKANGVTATTSDASLRTDHPLGQTDDDENNEGQDQIPIYEILPGAARLRHEDSDSGNSTDRSPKDTRLDLDDSSEGEPHFIVETTDPEINQSTSKSSSSKSELSRASSSGSNNDKVMIVTGNSQNMVVDLSAVPLDLREAIISGTALMTFPDGLRQLVDPGYTMITIPSDDHHPSNRNQNDDYGTKNKAQYWETIQNVSSPGTKGYRGKDKKQLTGLPFHPNHDSHTTPDFTLDGHRLAIQTRKVKNGKKRRCLCRICGMIFFLAAFLGVIVTLSLIYTNGQKYFGSA